MDHILSCHSTIYVIQPSVNCTKPQSQITEKVKVATKWLRKFLQVTTTVCGKKYLLKFFANFLIEIAMNFELKFYTVIVSLYTVFQKKFTLFVFTMTKSDVDQF